MRKQKHEAGAKWKQIDFNDGLKDATDELNYKVLKYIGEGGDINKEVTGINSEIPIIIWLEHVSESEHQDLDDFEFDIYVNGWVEGVAHVWKEIKDKL